MTGYNEILRLRRIEKELDELGFVIAEPKHGWNHTDMNYISIKPKDKDSLPIYSRDAELFRGTLEEINIWLRGVEWARGYDMLLKVSDDKKRARKEQDARNKQLIQRLKDEDLNLIDKNA
jgi:hypothetical protein